MSELEIKDYTDRLQEMMQRAGVSSFKALSRQAGVSQWQVRQLRGGKILEMRLEKLVKICQVLQVPVSELLGVFGIGETEKGESQASLEEEWRRLQTQLQQQRESLTEEFQQQSLQILESWLIQWPTAAKAAQQKPDLPAVRLLPLVRPVEQLLQQWGVETMEAVGEEVPYDPQRHQLLEGMAEPGQLVKVRYTGYRQGEKLLYRSKVSPV